MTRKIFVLVNMFLLFLLAVLGGLNLISLSTPIFILISIALIAVSFYEPRWIFWFLVGLMPLEIINIAPRILPFELAPYQLLALVLFLGIVLRKITGRSKLFFKFLRVDWLIGTLVLFGFISSVFSSEKSASFKQGAVLLSMALIYFLARLIIDKKEKLLELIPFLLGSSLVISLFSIWQNRLYMPGLGSFEVMPGRANGTFAEPEWLGIYLVSIIGAIFALLYCHTENQARNKYFLKLAILVPLFVSLILTASRSAWLAALFVMVVFLFITLTDLRFGNWKWRKFLGNFLAVAAVVVLSLGLVKMFKLTDFEIAKRAQSAGGFQEITVSCPNSPLAMRLPETISNLDELETYQCRHINLEEMATEEQSGNMVRKILRPDPNVNIRSEIYAKSWSEIKKHPVFGIGLGAIAGVLGTDKLGHSFNASNIFFEVWLGSGIFGLAAFVLILAILFINSLKIFSQSSDTLTKSISIATIVFLIGFTVFNLFNSGLLLGFFWVALGLMATYYNPYQKI